MRYAHTNLIAKDWQALSRFYQELFECVPVPPERHYRGELLENGTGIVDTELHGQHLRLPGYGDNGPTLEIYSYTISEEAIYPAVNRPGFAHLAFEVASVEQTQAQVLAAGGSRVGDIVTQQIATGAKVTWCYVRDPEGNILELQSWQK